MFSTTRTAFVALAAAMLIAACGSDDGGDSTSETTAPTVSVEATTPETMPDDSTPGDTTPDDTAADDTTPDTTEAATDDTTPDTTEAPSQDIAADTAAAEAALLTLADFPEGWTEAPAEGDALTAIDARLAECSGLDTLTSMEAQASTGDFVSPDGNLIVKESIGVQATELDARMINANLADPEVPVCLAAAYAEAGIAALSAGAAPEGATIDSVTASRVIVASAGSATQAIRVSIPVTANGATTNVTVDHVLTRAGRSIAIVTFENRAEATPIETIDPIVAAAAADLTT